MYITVLKPLRVNNPLLVTATEEKPRLLTYERHYLGVCIRRSMVDVYWDSGGFQGAILEKQVPVVVVSPNGVQTGSVYDSYLSNPSSSLVSKE